MDNKDVWQYYCKLSSTGNFIEIEFWFDFRGGRKKKCSIFSEPGGGGEGGDEVGLFNPESSILSAAEQYLSLYARRNKLL